MTQDFNFERNLNIIYGQNAQGKTSIIESIYFLSISKSFRTNSEKIVLQFSKEFFNIKGEFKQQDNQNIMIRVYYSVREGKHVFVNDTKLDKFSDLIGITPVILLSLQDLDLTYGVPSIRRRFLDILLSQVSPLYLHALQNYKRCLMQRNKLLDLISEKKESRKALFSWNEQLVNYGTELINYRLHFIDFLNSKINEYYQAISNTREKIRATYKSTLYNNSDDTSAEILKNRFADLLNSEYTNDLQRKSTSTGPHRDDIRFYMDEHYIKAFGSQGENKTFLVALKLIEGNYLKMKLNNDPIFLMDDIFGELDSERVQRLVHYLTPFGQTFITTTIENKFVSSALKNIHYIHLKDGLVVQ